MTKNRIGLALVALAAALLLVSCGSSPENGQERLSASVGKIPLPRMEPDVPYPVLQEKGIPIVRPDGPRDLRR